MNRIHLESIPLLKMNKILLIGHQGFLGSNLYRHIKSIQSKNMDFDIEVINKKFNFDNNFDLYYNFLNNRDFDLVFNCAAEIDDQKNENSIEIVQAHIFLPIFLYMYSKKNIGNGKNLKIVCFSSTSVNSPRSRYPIYAAGKSFENSIFLSMGEIFLNSNISWVQIVLPPLSGGLRDRIYPKDNSSTAVMEVETLNTIMNFVLESANGNVLDLSF